MKILGLIATPFLWVARLALALSFLIACFIGSFIALFLAMLFFAAGFEDLGETWTKKYKSYGNN